MPMSGAKQWSPHPYQDATVAYCLDRDCAGILLSPGLGKTTIALAIIEVLRGGGRKPWLLICPLGPLHLTWPAEIAKWADFEHLSIGILHGPKKDAVLMAKHDIYAINPEGLPWLFKQLAKTPITKWPFDKLLIDESTKFKNSQSQRFQVLKQYIKHFKRRIIMTGTPSPNGVADLFGQVYLLDFGLRLGRYITHFRREYMIDVAPHGAQYSVWRPVADAVPRVTAKIADICMSLKDADYLTMPKLIVNDITLQLDPAHAKTYRDVEAGFLAELKSGSVVSALAGGKGMVLRQLCGGSVYTNPGTEEAAAPSGDRPYEQIHTIKIDRLLDLIDEASGEPMLVAVAFRSEYDAIQKAMVAAGHNKPPYIGGGVSTKDRQAIQQAWNAGDTPVLIAHPTAVAHGLNLQAGGHVVVWYGMSYNREEYDQFIARVYRQGQNKPVIVHRLLMGNTIEQDIATALADKGETQDIIFKRLENRVNGHREESSTQEKNSRRRTNKRAVQNPAR